MAVRDWDTWLMAVSWWVKLAGISESKWANILIVLPNSTRLSLPLFEYLYCNALAKSEKNDFVVYTVF